MLCGGPFLSYIVKIRASAQSACAPKFPILGVTQKDMDKILIVRFSSLGDIILTTPVIEALKAKFPRSRIFFLTKSEYRDLLRADPRLSCLVELDALGRHKGASGLWGLISELRSQDFDLLLDLHANLRSFLVRHLVRSRRKLRYRKRRLTRFLMVHCRFVKTRPISTVDSYLEILKTLDIATFDKTPLIFTHEDDLRFAEDFLLERKIRKDDIVIGVHPGARWDTKRWDEERFVKVCRILLDTTGCKIVLFGDAPERDLVQRIKQTLFGERVVEAAGLPLGKLAGLIGRCNCLITNDTGPMHMATALSVPVVAIFGPTHPKLGFAPLGSKNVILCADAECSPCSLHGEKRCSKQSRICMELIKPEMVVDAVLGLLNQNKSTTKGA